MNLQQAYTLIEMAKRKPELEDDPEYAEAVNQARLYVNCYNLAVACEPVSERLVSGEKGMI